MRILQAWRSWRSARTVGLLAAGALAAGIGSATAIYTVVNAVMLKPLPYRDGGRFVALFGAAVNDPEHYASLSFKDAQTFQERSRAFDAFGWFREAGKNLTFAGEPHHIQGVAVTMPLAHALGVDPVVGQWFHDEHGVVISSALWRRLGTDPGIVGKGLTLDGRSYTVTGVMPARFHLPVAGVTSAGLRTDVWIPLDLRESGGGYFAYGRRKADVTFAAAEADVKRVAAEIGAEDPANHPFYTARLFDLRETVVKDIRPTLLLLFAAAGLLFLITCANAAGLLLARSVARARETAIRVALGARRRQLAAHYLAESVPVALAGAVAGVLLSGLLTAAIVSLAADYLPRSEEVAVDWTVWLFALAAAVVAAGLSSLAPLWQAARTAPADVLRDGARGSAGARSRRASQSLVVAEIALAFALLATSASLIAHVRNLSLVSAGFDPENLVTFTLSVPGPIADDHDKLVSFQQRLVEAVQTISGVDQVAFANQLPLDGCCMGTNIYPEGQPTDPTASQRMSLMQVSADYFQAMRIPVRSGRLLTERDWFPEPKIVPVVISESAAARYWSGRNPLDAYGRFQTPAGPRLQVVGVVGDVKNDGLANPSVPEFYMPGFLTRVETMHFVVRSARPAASLVPEVRRAVLNVDAEQPIHDATTMREVVRNTMMLERTGTFLTSFFAGAALLLATLGVYGAVSYSVRQRTVEIGTRVALGASSRSVLSLIVGGGLKMAAYGVIAGGVTALVAASYLGRVFQMGTLGAVPFLSSAAIIAAVAVAASFLPAWRASLLSPMVAIRNQTDSLWQAARLRIERTLRGSTTGDPPVVPLGTLIGEFADSVRRAGSFPEAAEAALTTLRERAGTESVLLLEKTSDQEYRGEQCSLPAHGVLLGRMRHYPHPLAWSQSDIEAWMRWARSVRPEHTTELDAIARTGARLAIPLRTKNEIVGVLLLGPPNGRERYTTAEKRVLESSADVFALMIENARLNSRALEQEKVRRDLALAAEVQKRLLPPRPPQSAFATLAAFSLPARTVGGDYYDFLDLADERIGIAIADISGKGIAAALLMSVVQASLQVISAERHISLPQLAAKMNGFLYRSTPASKYATFFCAQLEERGRRLRYVNAGHNPPYLVRRTTGGVEIMELRAGGTVLGLFPEVDYDEAAIDLRPGDLFVAFTDGVSEALNADGEEFGEERLKELLRGAVGTEAGDVSNKLAARMREWIGAAEQHDDLTFVVVAVSEEGVPPVH